MTSDAFKYGDAGESDGRDEVIRFLETTKTGKCSSFASASTLLYRYLGIPARYVVGILATCPTENEVTAIDLSSAHAWCEVFCDEVGWIVVDNTPGFVRDDVIDGGDDTGGDSGDSGGSGDGSGDSGDSSGGDSSGGSDSGSDTGGDSGDDSGDSSGGGSGDSGDSSGGSDSGGDTGGDSGDSGGSDSGGSGDSSGGGSSGGSGDGSGGSGGSDSGDSGGSSGGSGDGSGDSGGSDTGGDTGGDSGDSGDSGGSSGGDSSGGSGDSSGGGSSGGSGGDSETSKIMINYSFTDYSVTYTGKSIDLDGLDITLVNSTRLKDGHTIVGYDIVGKYINAGIYSLKLKLHVVDADGNDVSSLYAASVDGTITIKRRNILITTLSDSKEYDGTPLTCSDYTVNNLADSHVVSLDITGSITNVGRADNIVDVTSTIIIDQDGLDVTRNYKITYSFGTLTIN